MGGSARGPASALPVPPVVARCVLAPSLSCLPAVAARRFGHWRTACKRAATRMTGAVLPRRRLPPPFSPDAPRAHAGAPYPCTVRVRRLVQSYLREGATVVEFGAGAGATPLCLHCRLISIDHSEERLAAAAKGGAAATAIGRAPILVHAPLVDLPAGGESAPGGGQRWYERFFLARRFPSASSPRALAGERVLARVRWPLLVTRVLCASCTVGWNFLSLCCPCGV